jgi:hypothetical protein
LDKPGYCIRLVIAQYHMAIYTSLSCFSSYEGFERKSIGKQFCHRFFISQLMIFFGSLPVIIAAFIAFVVYKPFRPFRFVGISFVSAITLFAFLRAKDYYALGLYPVLIAFGGVYLGKLLSNGWKLYLRPLSVLFNRVLFLMIAEYMFPVLSPSMIVKNKNLFEISIFEGEGHIPIFADWFETWLYRNVLPDGRRAEKEI